jgi:hypothetical protein
MIKLNDFILLLGGWSVISIAVIYYFSNRIADRLNIKWKESADINISKLQGEIAKNNSTLNSVLALYGSNHHQAQDRRILAIEVLWKNLIEYKNIVPDVTHLLFNYLTEKEIEDFWIRETDNSLHHAHKKQLMSLDFDARISNSFDFIKLIELERPFIGERIWFHFDIYKIFLGRITYLMQVGTQDKKFEHWQKDKHLKQLLSDTLSSKEVDYIYSLEVNSLKSTSILLEGKLIQEIDKTLSGEAFSETVLDRVKKFENVMSWQEY